MLHLLIRRHIVFLIRMLRPTKVRIAEHRIDDTLRRSLPLLWTRLRLRPSIGALRTEMTGPPGFGRHVPLLSFLLHPLILGVLIEHLGAVIAGTSILELLVHVVV